MTERERASEAFTEIVEALFDSQVEELEDLIDTVSTYLNKEVKQIPRYECYLNAGLILEEVEAKDADEAREKAYNNFLARKQEYMEDMAHDAETTVYEIKEDK